VVRSLLFLLGMLSADRPVRREARRYRADSYGRNEPGTVLTDPDGPDHGDSWADHPEPLSPWPPRATGRASPARPRDPGPGSAPRRRRIPFRLKWVAVAIVAGLIFRRAIAATVLISLSAALHFLGINVHLPNIRFAWPWQTITAGTTTNTDLGPWVLQKIEGISKPALGTETFDFYFTHKVSKSIGPWPCWYASTFYAVGHASATVNLNPGPSWWTPASGHYQLQVLSRPAAGKPGHVSVVMVLPPPQLPQSVHDVSIDDTLSKPIDTQHSWTYPGFGCGALLRPQFSQSVLFSLAQQIAFDKATHVTQVTRPLISTAENQASQIIRNNFIQPTVNAFGYTLDSFTINWATAR
jgi:hypothetical protein